MFGLDSRVQEKRARQQQQTSRVVSIPAPVGGWNARDALADMAPSDAVALVNWFPAPTSVNIRNGYSQWSTGYANPVNTVMLYAAGGTQKLWAASGTGIYDATAGGAVGGATVTGLNSTKFIYTMWTTTAAVNYLVAVNDSSSDYLQAYNGSTWTAITGVSTPAITGVDSRTFRYVVRHVNRLWAIETNTLHLWYSPVGAFGAFSLFDLGPIFQRGGHLVAMEVWTVDGGYGMQDYLVCITDQGEVAIYGGTDPSSTSTWALVGVYYFSAPIGTRCMFKFGGDVLLLTCDGVFPLSSSLQSTRIDVKAAITDKILYAVSNAASLQFSTFGWQTQTIPSYNALLINVPTAGTDVAQQFVMNTITGAWCQFTGRSAYCWEPWGENLYFGGPTYVGWAFEGYTDNGAQIVTDVECAYNYLGNRGALKQFTMARPVIQSSGPLGLSYGVNVDYQATTTLNTPSVVSTTSSTWDGANWDAGIWGTNALTTQRQWQYLSGIGYAASFVMQTASIGAQAQFASVDILFEPGGVL